MSILSQPLSIFASNGRKIDTIAVQTIINENTSDTLTVTKQPVQQGASINDHAYMEPTTFSTQILFAANIISTSLEQIYTALQKLQMSFVPFTIVTPKRTYKNMLITGLGMTTDRNTENALAITLSCIQINLVSITITNVPKKNQKKPQATNKTQPVGQKSSSLLTAKDAVVGAVQKIVPLP